MIKHVGMTLLLPIWILASILSPYICYKYWVKTDKTLNTYESFWKTWATNMKEIWVDDLF